MAYDEELADRVRDALAPRSGLSERKMFGGIAFMLDGNMAVGIVGTDLMVRLEPEEAQRALHEDHVRPMDFTGRPPKSMVFVAEEALVGDDDLAAWVDAGADHAATLPPK